jgi:hypothetical protein
MRIFLAACVVLLAGLLPGCSRLRHAVSHETVYVVVQQTYLHDRVAAVSNTVGEVKNGQSLEVLEHGRRFLKVKTAKNEIGWIEQHAIIDQKTYDAFVQLADQHKNDAVITTGTVRYDAYLHLAPGRNTERYYLLPGNAKLQLLVRASVPKVAAGAPLRKVAPPVAAPAAGAAKKAGSTAASAATAAAMPPPVMEDWWLVRDEQGHAGWILSGGMDMDAPDEIAQYAEGARILGAYVLNKVHDENVDQNGQPVVSEKPQYVAVLAPMKSGLPFDFDQVRVFTWNPKRHRYETAFRLHPIAGFLPVTVTQAPAQGVIGITGPVPQFSIRIGSPENVMINPDTGVASGGNARTINFQLIQTTVKRVGPDMNPIELTKTEEKKELKGKKKSK